MGEYLDVQAAKAAARQTGLAILSTFRASLGSLDRVKRVASNSNCWHMVDNIAEIESPAVLIFPERMGDPVLDHL